MSKCLVLIKTNKQTITKINNSNDVIEINHNDAQLFIYSKKKKLNLEK